MKTTINENGVLSVESENELEAFALKKWAEDYTPDKPDECKAVLRIAYNQKK
jgi:hypothetical protein